MEIKNFIKKIPIYSMCFSLCFLSLQFPVYAFESSSSDVAALVSTDENDKTTLALYHFDGNGKDSSDWENSDALLGSNSFMKGKFGQGVIVAPDTQIEIFLENELDVKNFTLELTLLNAGNDISDVYFMIEDTVFLRNDSLIKNGENTLVFQGGSYDIDLSRLPISKVYYVTGSSKPYQTKVFENQFIYKNISFALSSDMTFYKNGEKNIFTSENSDSCSVSCDYTFEFAGMKRPSQGSTYFYIYYDLVTVKKYLPNTVDNKTGIYIFKDSIIIKNTSSQSIVLDELRVSSANLYFSDTVSVSNKPFGSNISVTPEMETETVMSMVDMVLRMIDIILSSIINNPVLVVMFAFSFVGIGIVVFEKIRNVTKKN